MAKQRIATCTTCGSTVYRVSKHYGYRHIVAPITAHRATRTTR